MNLLNALREFRYRAAASFCSKPADIQLSAPLVSFTFDDVPLSAFTFGVPILEKYGARATFYVTGSNCTRPGCVQKEDILELARRGHEIACHSFSHKRMDKMSTAQIKEDCARNREYFEKSIGTGQLKNFAYPSGALALRTKNALRGSYLSLRGVHGGINSGPTDLLLLRANSLSGIKPRQLKELAEKTALSKGWLIFYSHDVSSSPSPWGVTPETLEAAVKAALAAGLKIATVDEAVSQIGPAL